MTYRIRISHLKRAVVFLRFFLLYTYNTLFEYLNQCCNSIVLLFVMLVMWCSQRFAVFVSKASSVTRHFSVLLTFNFILIWEIKPLLAKKNNMYALFIRQTPFHV